MTGRERRAPRGWLGALLVLGVAACSSETTTIVLPQVDVVVASGDGQFGTVGQELANPLRVVVLSTTTGSPQEGRSVNWDIASGDASLVGIATTVTDETGSTEIRVRLGATPGDVVVRATVADQPSANTSFTVFTVDPPRLDQVIPSSVAAGGTVTLIGSNFIPVDMQNVVLFSGVRGRVLSSTPTSLDVEVPTCLPARDVAVRVQLGTVPSQSVTLTVTGGAQITPLEVGEVLDVVDDAGLECHALEGGPGIEYLTIVYSGSTVGAALHPFELTALSSTGPPSAPARVSGDSGAPGPAPQSEPDPQAAWDQYLRGLESEMVRGGVGRFDPTAGPARVGPARVPVVGESRTFSVLNAESGFDEVTAIARYVGNEAAIFVDEEAPAGGFDQEDLELFAERFDQVIHPEVTAAFGQTSDLDENDRVVILFTPVVNGLTARGTQGFVGGFFFGRDLQPGEPGSNEGEVFYSLVPDPAGQFSDPRPKNEVLRVVPAVLAHEFQHMVHWNERIIRLSAPAQEALWLSEGLAQMAEEVVARAYQTLGATLSTELFREGARVRARRYLRGPDSVSVIVTVGQGSLAERGAGFLQTLYLEDQSGSDILRRLTQTSRRGVANVEVAFGRPWRDMLIDWWSAIYLDGPAPESGALVYPDVNLRGFLESPYPLEPTPVGPDDFSAAGSLWSSSAAYYIVSPPSGGSATLRLGGASGGASAVQSALRMRIIRLS